jgi:hypothetical protein
MGNQDRENMMGNKVHKRERERERERERKRKRDLGREGERSGGERKRRGSFEKMAWVV